MSRDDPFETWHLDPELKNALSPQKRAQLDAQARTALDELQRFLDDPPPRGNLGDVRIGLLREAYGDYPRVTASHGETEQYPSWEEE